MTGMTETFVTRGTSSGATRGRYRWFGLLLPALICVASAYTPAIAEDGDAAEALASKFTGTSQGAPSGGTPPEILRKIQAVKKKADEARAKRKREQAGGQQTSQEASRKAALAAKAQEEARQAELSRQQDAARAAEEESRRMAEVARKEAEEKAAREAEVARKEVELKEAREAEVARKKALEERQKAEQQKRETQRVADAAREAEERRREEERQLKAQEDRVKKRQREADARRKKAAKDAAKARAAEEARQEKIRKSLEKRRKEILPRRDADDGGDTSLQKRMQAAERRRQIEEARRNDWNRAAEGMEANRVNAARAREAMALQRREEADRLSSRLRNARNSRSSLGARDLESIGTPLAPITANNRHVTILLVMDVGKKGVRRWSKTADPMLCIKDKCYLSNGAQKPSRALGRKKAFGPSVALGMRGLACRSSPACVFRNVDLLGPSAALQPVDLKFLRHDRRETRRIAADRSCTMVGGKLRCDKLFGTTGWRAWVIPESVAQWAGAEALQAAVKSGLR